MPWGRDATREVLKRRKAEQEAKSIPKRINRVEEKSRRAVDLFSSYFIGNISANPNPEVDRAGV